MIPNEEWLPQAKRLSVGMKTRVYHKRERRPNLVIGHEVDKYWCYCQACKQGSVKLKEHVRLEDGYSPERTRSDLTLPQDMRPVLGDLVLENAIGAFLANKGMDFKYLPNLTQLMYSKSRKRLLLNTNCDVGAPQWLGRDISGAAREKWLSYNNVRYMGTEAFMKGLAIVVEDPFSYFKVIHAVKGPGMPGVYCSLGTRMHRELMLELIQYHDVLFFYDGDKAGYDGAKVNAQRLSVFGPKCVLYCAPPGLDPKDMTLEHIREHVQHGLAQANAA